MKKQQLCAFNGLNLSHKYMKTRFELRSDKCDLKIVSMCVILYLLLWKMQMLLYRMETLYQKAFLILSTSFLNKGKCYP